jgi:hypothetical protein
MNTHDDLKALATESDWFVTVTIPTPSNLDDAQARFEVEWRNARRQFSDRWDDDELARLDELVGGLRHSGGASLIVIHASHGSTLVEVLEEPVTSTTVHEGSLPRLATVIEARQRAIPHVVVEIDRGGADLTAFDGGDVLETDAVEASTAHIHRGHPGGWAQHRFQYRAEDAAHEVGEAVTDLARQVDAQLIVVAGDIRAQTFMLESLPADLAGIAVRVDAGSAEGIAGEIVRTLSTIVAQRVTAAAELVRAGIGHGTASLESAVIADALRDGRVDTLLVHDDGGSGSDTATEPDGTRTIDRNIVAALSTDAEVLVVPHLAMMDEPFAAVMRW